ncbi:MAG: phosphatase PAP2 family protein [Gammaproteobacteria bacterium]|tara:strand:- start:362 stop:1219 length:858 start_codon:yes stop_codon:yes gene_type:complete
MSIWNDLSWVESIRSPFLSLFFESITLMGYPTFLILFISFGYFFWSSNRFSRVAILLFISALINSFLKDFFQDPRPPQELMLDPQIGVSYGWPSGHTQIAVTLWGFLAYELKNKLFTIFAVLLIALIAFSRMYLGVHDLGDIFSGLLIGLLILGIWHIGLKLNLDKELSSRTWLLLILGFQTLTFITYPSHENHELSVWLLGVMTGWFIGSSSIELKLNFVNKLLISFISVFIVFLSMIFITRIEDSTNFEGVFSFGSSYLLGIIFSLIVTWIIPRVWKVFKLAS